MKRSLSAIGLSYAHRRKWLHIVAAALMLVVLTLGAATPALTFASDPEEILNDTEGPENASAEELERRNWKQSLLDGYADVKAGRLSAAAHQEMVDEYVMAGSGDKALHQAGDHTEECPADALVPCFDPTEDFGTPDPDGASAPDAAFFERNILWTAVYVPQPNGYYCGPATAFSMLYHLRPRGNWTSYWGDALSQSNLAAYCPQGSYACPDMRGKFLMTDWYGQTNWNVRFLFFGPLQYPMKDGLNRWLTGNAVGDYNVSGVPYTVTISHFRQAVTMDIDYSWPVAANVVENVDNSGRLNGHPSDRPIYHWVSIRGYSNWGGNVHYVDSAYQGVGLGPGFTLTSGNQRITMEAMHTMVKQRGFVW